MARENFSLGRTHRGVFASSSSGCKLCLVSPFIRAGGGLGFVEVVK